MKTFTRIEQTDIYEVGDRFKKSIVVKRYRTEDGIEHEFTTVDDEHAQSAAVIALTPDHRVVVSQQFRAGRERYVDDIPGGKSEAGEEPEQVARRELNEETGYETDQPLQYLGCYSWDAYNNLTSHYFLATDCRLAEQHTVEDIEQTQGLDVALISIEQLIENAKTNNMTDAVAVLMAIDQLRSIEGVDKKEGT
ncbi:MAG: NUDIX hydrolase [Candidatus Saccharimonadales bacterium]